MLSRRDPGRRSLLAAFNVWRRPLPAPRPLSSADVTVVVLNWNRRDATLACLESLARAELGGATVLVVDNGSRDGSAAAVRARYPEVAVLELPENQGYAGGNNAGVRWALERGAGATLLLNNDTEVGREVLAPLIEILNTDARAAAVSSAVMRHDSPETLSQAFLELYFGYGLVRLRGGNALPGEGYDQIAPVEVAVGCSLLVRAEAWRHVGLLAEAYFAYHEDVEWCFRARRAGYRIMYQPWSQVWHHGSTSTDAACSRARQRRVPGQQELPNPVPLTRNPVRAYLGARNSIRFIRRHAHVLRKLRFALSVSYQVPLQLLAVVTDREDDFAGGFLTYRSTLGWYLVEAAGAPRDTWAAGRPSAAQWAAGALRAPLTLLATLPRDVRRARREGRTQEIEACLRGYRDGLLGRPIPLRQLGLRP